MSVSHAGKFRDPTVATPPASGGMCPVEMTVKIIGGKWKPYVLFNLIKAEQRYSDLTKAIPLISDRMLTRALKELEADQLVTRTVKAERPIRVTYSLTKDGETLIPILQAMVKWVTDRR